MKASMKSFPCISLIVLLMLSCSNHKSVSIVQKIISDQFLMPIDSFSYVLIIPMGGCPGCLEKANRFLKTNLNKHGFCYIITDISSEKKVQTKYGSFYDKCRIGLDIENILLQAISTEYPILVRIEGRNKFDLQELGLDASQVYTQFVNTDSLQL